MELELFCRLFVVGGYLYFLNVAYSIFLQHKVRDQYVFSIINYLDLDLRQTHNWHMHCGHNTEFQQSNLIYSVQVT